MSAPRSGLTGYDGLLHVAPAHARYERPMPVRSTDAALTWIPAENVFTAQRQLVTLLAVIAAIGMPVGAMTAIVFFGQAVISSGRERSGSLVR